MKEEKKIGSGVNVKGKAIPYKKIMYSALSAFAVFMFGTGTSLMQTYPFGIALFCAMSRYVTSGALGLLLSALTLGEVSWMHLSGFVLCIVFRLGVNFVSYGREGLVGEYRDTVAAKVASGIVGTMCISLMRIISGGFLYYDLIGSLFYINCVAFMTWVYNFAHDRKYRGDAKFRTGVYALLFSLTACLRGVSVLGMGISVICAFVTVFAVSGRSDRSSAANGAVIGLLCGAALGIDICPMFALIGILSGCFAFMPVYIRVVFSASVGIFAFAAVQGVSVLSTYLPEAAVAGVLYTAYITIFSSRTKTEAEEAVSVIPDVQKYDDTGRLCDALMYLSTMFGKLAQKQNRPAVHELSDLLCDTFCENCKGCNSKKVCFGTDRISSSHILRPIAEKIYKKGVCTSSDLPEQIRQSCYFKDKLTAKINIAISHLNEEKSKYGKLQVMESDYADMASLILSARERDEAEGCENAELRQKLLGEAVLCRIFSDIRVYGTRCITLICIYRGERAELMSQKDILSALESFCLCRFYEPEYMSDGRRTVMKVCSRPRFEIQSEKLSVGKQGEKNNGDSAELFQTERGYFYCMICDGMGSGDEAALTSGTSAVFLKTLLNVGCEKESAVKCLNNFVASKDSECFTTADVLSIDMYSGKCSFIKCGACASLVVRGENIYKLTSHTPPVGIMKQLCAEKSEFDLCSGDTVVMMSDGVWDWVKEPTWLYEMLTLDRAGCDREELCRRIAKRAGDEDDVTVCIIDIVET